MPVDFNLKTQHRVLQMARDLWMVRGSFARARAHGSSLTGRRRELGHGEMFMWSITQNENIAQTYLERQKGLLVILLA